MSDSFPLLHGLPDIHCDDLPQRGHMAAGARGILDNLLNRRLRSVKSLRVNVAYLLQTAKRVLCRAEC